MVTRDRVAGRELGTGTACRRSWREARDASEWVVNTFRVRVLIFSNSDVVGSFVGGEGWGTMLAQGGDAALEVSMVPFFPGAPTAAAYAAKKVAEFEPDLVVLPVGGYGFTSGYVEFRVKRLFGRRVSAGYKAVERWFDRKTRPEGGLPRGVNAFARTVLRHTIGTEPPTSQAEITGYVCSTIDALARFEETNTLLGDLVSLARAQR